jgi:hypothetical protein
MYVSQQLQPMQACLPAYSGRERQPLQTCHGAPDAVWLRGKHFIRLFDCILVTNVTWDLQTMMVTAGHSCGQS